MTPSSKGYEISIFSEYGPFFWILISYVIISGIVLLIYGIETKNNLYHLAVLYFIIIYGIFLFLPILRGYQFSGNIGTDIFYHLSEIFNIINTAHYDQKSIYPLSYVVPSIFIEFGLPELYTTTLLNFSFVLTYIASIYLIGNYFGSGKTENKIFFLIASLPLVYSVFYVNFYPFIYALLIFPLMLYSMIMYISSPGEINRRNYIVVFLVLSFFIIFLHPVVALFLILAVLSLLIAQIIFLYHTRENIRNLLNYSSITNSLSLLSVIFVFWIISSLRLTQTLSNIYSEFSVFGEEALITKSASSVSASSADIWYIIELFIKKYYSLSLYLILASIITLIIVYRFVIYKKITLPQMQLVVLFSVSMIVSLFFTLTYAAMGFFERSFSFALMIGTILIGFFIAELYTQNSRFNRYIAYSIICLIMISTLFCVFGLYPSPWKSLPNSQTSQMEFKGYEWSISHTDDRYNIPFLSFVGKIDKFVRYYDSKFSIEYRYYDTINFKIKNYGYDDNRDYLSESLATHPSYLLVTKYMNTYQNSLPENRRDNVISFNEVSNYRLQYSDPSAILIYSNGEFKEFFVI